MNLLRFVSALLLLSVSAFGQAVDYRALGTNSYYTNGLRVNDKHWTNSAGLYRYQPLTGTVAAGQPGPPLVLRSDGSAFVGTNVFQDVAPTASGIFFPYAISMTDSNEPTTVHGDWWAIDSENYGVYAGAALTVQQAGLSTLVLSGDTGAEIRVTTLGSGPGQDAINVSSNAVNGFRVSEGGDLTLINALAYTWPTARGPAGSVLTDAAANGTLTWAPSGGGSASIGPGTNNYYAKFDSTGTNVVNSPTKSAFTNSIEHFLLPNTTGTITFTNGATTNRMYSMFAHAGTNTYLEFVSAVPFSAEAAHIRHVTTGFTSQRAAIYINDSVAIEPAANQLGGHGAGYLYPLSDGLQDNGTTSLRWRDVNLARVVTAPARDDSIIFGTGFTGQGFGVGTAGTLYFTGPGSFGWQMNRDKNTGSPQLDMSSSLLGFGTSTSNSVSYLQESTLTGYVQVGTNNANTATARAQGIIAARASGTDRPGSDLLLAAGMGTGNAITPKIRFQSSNPGSTGSGLNNTLIDRMIIDTNTVTIYSNLVVNGTITAGGAGGGGLIMTNNNVNNFTLFTNNGVSFNVNQGALNFTNFAASGLGLQLATNGTLYVASIDVSSVSGVILRGATASTRYKINNGGQLGFPTDSALTIYNDGGTLTVRAGGTLESDFTATNNVGTGEDNLAQYSVPAARLAVNGDYLEFDAWGTFAANATAKQVKAYFGATTLIASGSLTGLNGIGWRINGRIVRTGATTQTATATITVGGTLLTTAGTSIESTTSPAETLSGAVILKCTGEAGADNDIVQNGLNVKWYPNQ